MEADALMDRDRLRAFLKREARHWGEKCKARRKALRLTLDEVAQLSGTTPQTVFKVERGEIVARDSLKVGLAFALMCEVGDLFPVPPREVIAREVAA